MVLFHDWSWTHLISSGTGGLWTRATYGTVTENNNHYYLEPYWFSRCQHPVQEKQIQRSPLYFCYFVISCTLECRRSRATDRKLIVHTGNARSHRTKVSLDFIGQNEMKMMPYFLYSQDLRPSNFSFRLYWKNFQSLLFPCSSWLLLKIQIILAYVEKLSYWTFLLSGCEGWNNIAISMEPHQMIQIIIHLICFSCSWIQRYWWECETLYIFEL
jgi:hypothetical protein